MAATDNANQSLVVTAFWEVNPGEEAAVAGLLKEFLPQAQREPGVKEFQIHQNLAEPRKYFFYEVFAGEAAFADHQQTPHFKNIIVGAGGSKACEARTLPVPLHLTSRVGYGASLANSAARRFISSCSRLLPARPAAISNAARASSKRPSFCRRSPRTPGSR